MSAISNYLEEKLLNHVFRNTAYTPSATVFLALFLNNPTDAGTGTEVSGTAYVRKAVTFNAPTQVSGKAQIVNTSVVEFPQAGGAWGNVTHAAIYDSVTLGNMLYYGPLRSPKLIEASDVMRVLAGELKLLLD